MRAPLVGLTLFVASVALVGCQSSRTDPPPSPSRIEPTSTPIETGDAARGTYSFRDELRATPSFIGPGAAGACVEPERELVTIVFQGDVPSSRCFFVKGSERLHIASEIEVEIEATLGPLTMVLPPNGSVTVREPFERYLDPGGHSLDTNLYGGDTYGVEIRYEPHR